MSQTIEDKFTRLWQEHLRKFHAGGCLYLKSERRIDGRGLEEFSAKFGYHKVTKRFSDNRKEEFLLGRWCAHQAFDQYIGEKLQSAIGVAPDRAPVWPEEIVGSISHNEHCVVSLSAVGVKGIGIDIESKGRLNERLSEKILIDEDRKLLKAPMKWSADEFYTFVFSAKESLYKAIYHEVKSFFGFSEAFISEFSYEDQSFVISVHQDSFLNEVKDLPKSFQGFFIEDEGNIFTMILWK